MCIYWTLNTLHFENYFHFITSNFKHGKSLKLMMIIFLMKNIHISFRKMIFKKGYLIFLIFRSFNDQNFQIMVKATLSSTLCMLIKCIQHDASTCLMCISLSATLIHTFDSWFYSYERDCLCCSILNMLIIKSTFILISFNGNFSFTIHDRLEQEILDLDY